MDFILNGVTTVLNAMSMVLVGFDFTRNLGQDLAKVSGYLQKANMILPITAVLFSLSMFVSIQLALIAYYWITRALNLLRGAG